MAVEQFLVPGVVSDDSVRAISAAVNILPGVRLVTVNIAHKSVRVEHNGHANVAEVIHAIKALGYAEVAILA